MFADDRRPRWAVNSYTLVWPLVIPSGRCMVEVCAFVHIPDFKRGDNEFRIAPSCNGDTFHVLTEKQRTNIERWLEMNGRLRMLMEELNNAKMLVRQIEADVSHLRKDMYGEE